MFQLDLLIDISILPSNIMALRDDDFIDFVKEERAMQLLLYLKYKVLIV
jgi:hypothetical protein